MDEALGLAAEQARVATAQPSAGQLVHGCPCPQPALLSSCITRSVCSPSIQGGGFQPRGHESAQLEKTHKPHDKWARAPGATAR